MTIEEKKKKQTITEQKKTEWVTPKRTVLQKELPQVASGLTTW